MESDFNAQMAEAQQKEAKVIQELKESRELALQKNTDRLK